MSKEVRRSFRLSQELADQVDVARGFESWSSWVTRALEKALTDGGLDQARPVVQDAVRRGLSSASSRPSADPLPEVPLPKIAPRRVM